MEAAGRQAQQPIGAPADAEGHTARHAAALRGATAQAAEWVGGPILLFACGPDEEPLLRAAAKLTSASAARTAAAEVIEAVRMAIRDGTSQTLAAVSALPGSAAGAMILPLRCEGASLGALAIGLAEPLSPARSQLLEPLSAAMASRLDTLRLADENHRLRSQMLQSEHLAETKNDQVLKLSEELFAQDIELLRSNEKLGKIEKLKNDFIEKMSRELRTPLNSIIESIIAVLAGENDALSETAKVSLRSALDDGTAFLRTLQNILDLWRIKQGELPVEVQDVNFREVVEEAIFSVQDTLGSKRVTIHKHFGEPLPKIRTDLAKINQILFLLLDNAAKFTSEGTIEITVRVSEGQLHCEIRDSGIGICPDDQQFIFDEFYQVDDLASTKYRGAGLGLALVRDLLVLLDGEISVSSQVGRGSCFTFMLPVQTIAV